MTIYTRAGDGGQTSLADGTRIAKGSPRVEAYGTVDEANSHVGFARAATADPVLDEVLHFMQQRLFNCSSNLATPAEHRSEHTPVISEDDIAFLESAIDRFMKAAGPLEHFVIPAGGETSSRIHLARTIVRRAERRADALASTEEVDPQVLCFLNRSSDVLFAAARYAAAAQDFGDEQWNPAAPIPALD